MVVEKISEKVLETLNNGEKGNILVYSQHSPPPVSITLLIESGIMLLNAASVTSAPSAMQTTQAQNVRRRIEQVWNICI